MKLSTPLTLRDRAGISALWGTIFLFLIPLTALWVFSGSPWEGMIAILLMGLGCSISALIGVLFFARAVGQLTEFSKEKVARKH